MESARKVVDRLGCEVVDDHPALIAPSTAANDARWPFTFGTIRRSLSRAKRTAVLTWAAFAGCAG
jgi:hypothetical protein